MKMLKVISLGLLATLVNSHCDNLCSGHGMCNPISISCQCWSKWTGADCSLRVCPSSYAWADQATSTDTAHAMAVCSNQGLCNTVTGQCQCNSGFTGNACERMICPDNCSGHGECFAMSYNAKLKDPNPFFYDAVWDSEMVYGCYCDPFYTGYSCNLLQCPQGDDPMTTGQVNEIQYLQCLSSGSGYFTITFEGATTQYIYDSDNLFTLQAKLQSIGTIKSVNLIAEDGGATVCSTTSPGRIISIEFTQNFGALPPMTIGMHAGGISSVAIAAAASGLTSFSGFTAQAGTKENIYCSGRGLCDHTTGICECSENFLTSNGLNAAGTRGDCGFAAAAIVGCPGIISCSGHGVCSNYPQYVCACDAGWQGADCSERVCPFDIAWFDFPSAANVAHASSECSKMGYCDRSTGVCNCYTGFEGAACERISCPKSDGTALPCNGNGRCLSMAELAVDYLSNGVPTSITYGMTPNNPLTWDFRSLWGCLCDAGFEGYDCSKQSCPTGDNPRTSPGVPGIQIVNCITSTSGTFSLQFRTGITAPISSSASVSDVTAALLNLPYNVLNGVSVSFIGGATACSSGAGTDIQIIFSQDFGPLPAMTVASKSSSLTVTIYANGATSSIGTVSVACTKENDLCSDHGVCDYATGVCQCFTGWGSSDGYNNMGLRGDCGYQIPAYSQDDTSP